MLLARIDNIDVFCSDVPTMARFYHETLALELLYTYEPETMGWFAIQSGDVSVYFLSAQGEPPVGRGVPTHGLESFSFAVENLDDAIAFLDGKVQWLGDVREWRHANGTWYRFRAFTDPEGNKLSVTEPHKTVRLAGSG